MESLENRTYPELVASEESARPGSLFRLLSGTNREWVFWGLQILFWGFIGLIGYLMTRAFRASMPQVEAALAIRIGAGFLLSSCLRMIYLQPWLRQNRRLKKWACVAASCLSMALLELGILFALVHAGFSLPGGVEHIGLKMLVVRLFILGLWSALYFAVHMFETEHALELRAAQAELAAREHELRHLQAQMNPHVVFNSLKAVRACKHDPAAVEEVTESLADYLRYLMQNTRPLEPLGRELEALEKFLTSQTAHFKGNLVCRIQWDPEARSVMVPPMMIQPLIEDAFHYRSENNDLPLQIWLTARMEEGFLRVGVSNTGDWVPPESGDGKADGVDLLRKRLKLLMGSQAQVERQIEQGWIRVTIHIPLPTASRNPSLEVPAS